MHAERTPCLALFVGIVMVQVVSAHLPTRQNVGLASVDDVERYAQALHQRGASAA